MQVSSYKDDADNKNDLNDEKTDDYVWLWEIDDRYYGFVYIFLCVTSLVSLFAWFSLNM